MKAEVIDVTLPAKKAMIGHRHPNSIALEEVERIFIGMGYEVVEGPEVEYADYNFTKLNIPEDHPARDEQDTSLSMILSFFVPRLPRYRHVPWKRQTSDPYDRTGTCIPF